MPKFIDLTGKTFGKLTVIKKMDDKVGNHIMWLCKCDCGNVKTIRGSSLTSGESKSCGCVHRGGNSRKCNNREQPTVNTYNLSGEYGTGYTSKGKEFYFDLEDYDKIKNYSWNIFDDGYVSANYHRVEDGCWTKIKMHRLVMNVTDSSIIVDHIHHNRNDNRKSQLRIVTTQQNAQNHLPYSNRDCPSGIYKYKDKWRAGIGIDNKILWLGIFDKYEDALQARKDAEDKYFGEFKYQEL